MGEVVDFASARLRLGHLRAPHQHGSPLLKKISIFDELNRHIPQNSACDYWPVPVSPNIYVRLPLNGLLSHEAARSLREGMATVVMLECGEQTLFKCAVANVRQSGSNLDIELTLLDLEKKSSFEIGAMSGAIMRVSLTVGSFRTVRDRPRRELIPAF